MSHPAQLLYRYNISQLQTRNWVVVLPIVTTPAKQNEGSQSSTTLVTYINLSLLDKRDAALDKVRKILALKHAV